MCFLFVGNGPYRIYSINSGISCSHTLSRQYDRWIGYRNTEVALLLSGTIIITNELSPMGRWHGDTKHVARSGKIN